MKSLVAAALVLGLASGVAAAAPTIAPQADGSFCSGAPDGADSRIASAVNALGVSVPSTPAIAVVDTGVSDEVPELQGKLTNAFDSTTGGSDAHDVDGHGTEVAGIAAGVPGLIQGVSPTSPIMPVRVYSLSGASTTQWLVAGINWAVSQGAAVVNISSSLSQADASAADVASLTRAISESFNKRILVVASVGNDGTSAPQIPAALPHVLGIGGSDLTGARATFSNTGPWVDLVAPAVSLVGPTPKTLCPTGYGVVNGTSFGAPSVSAAVALLAQVHPEYTAQQRFDVIRSTAHDVAPTGRDDETGFGLLNVGAVVNGKPAVVESSPEVDDDPYFVRGVNAAAHPVLLKRTRKVRVAGQLSAAKDPSDIFRVQLKKNERLTVSAKVAGKDSLIGLALWKPTVGDFDVTNDVAKQRVVSSGGFSNDVALKMNAKKGGTYYVSIEAPDPVDEDDPSAIVPASMTYQMLLSKTKVPVKKPKKTKRKSTKR